MEKYCDQLVLRIANILRTAGAIRQLVEMGKKGYQEHDNTRGFIPLVFEQPEHAQDMIQNYTKDSIIRINMHYIPDTLTGEINVPELREMMNEYDSERECVCLICVCWEGTVSADNHAANSSMKPVIISRDKLPDIHGIL